ncbi:DUF2235 domain-containing protein [Rhodobacteraceae bacterium NNCM2]|nr:DUF2235 domain-containing protein [Coraliihabitans acroporae]
MTRRLIYISDGTLSTLRRGEESNAGRLFRLLEEVGQRPSQLFDYDRGVQGPRFRKWLNAASGYGINRSVLRGYAFLSTRWRPGDQIFLFGFSRGAYAVRSLAGMIGHLGLVREGHRGERRMREAFGLYKERARAGMAAFADQHCIRDVPIQMIGVWDTVRALGLPYPILSYLAPMATEFHDASLGAHIAHGYHALAIDEDRTAFAPILWQQSPDWRGRLEQMWFPGTHGDVGGDLRGFGAARALANIPLNWMLSRAERCGMSLPPDWQARFPEDPAAPMLGCRRGISRGFLFRAPRRTDGGDGTMLHLSIAARMRADPSYRPRGRIGTDTAPMTPGEVS